MKHTPLTGIILALATACTTLSTPQNYVIKPRVPAEACQNMKRNCEVPGYETFFGFSEGETISEAHNGAESDAKDHIEGFYLGTLVASSWKAYLMPERD
ncbi:hypothetical protein J4421_02400 [Candidatus Woesearchaeota archaeon]|nr:hypothetical protein [Candidatus Woesearchaeota archaeon]